MVMVPDAPIPDGLEIDVQTPMEFPDGVEVLENPDGSVDVGSPGGEEPEMEARDLPHRANLAEVVPEGELSAIARDLITLVEEDDESREEWKETYAEGIELLGIKLEESRTEPFEGATSVTHPVFAEAIVQFQAQAYKELVPAEGPVKTKVNGPTSAELEAQATRIKHYLNYVTMEEMEEFEPDTDQLLFFLPISGSCFKKLRFDASLNRTVSEFVRADDIIVPYSASSLRTSPRITHAIRMEDNELRKLQIMGIYRDVELRDPGVDDDDNPVQEAIDDAMGQHRGTSTRGPRNLYEVYTNLELLGDEELDELGDPLGLALPYIVTIDKDSETVLGIRRNWAEEDDLRKPQQYFAHYRFMPGPGFYGLGVTHYLGNLGKAATSLLRQLIDAGTLANLPGGLKARGVNTRGNNKPIQPGEWRDIDVPSGSIRDALMPMPYKEPSATLANLLGALVDAGRRFVSVADQQVSNMSQEMPVGTTVALLERGMKVLSAIHKRLHRAQRDELKILARLISENIQSYPYEVGPIGRQIAAQDFSDRIDVLPVSDPNIFSMAQRVALAQEQLTLAQSNPEIHDVRAAYRRMYLALEVANIEELLPPPPQPQPKGPAGENADLLTNAPTTAFPDQHHESHIETHIELLQLSAVKNSPIVLGGLYAHVMQHIGMLAAQQIQMELQEQMEAAQRNPNTDPALLAEVQKAIQDPVQMAQYQSVVESQLVAQYIPELIVSSPNDDDPLVQIRNKEVDVAARKHELDVHQFKHQQKMDVVRTTQTGELSDDRISSQQKIAQQRDNTNRYRIAMTEKLSRMKNGGTE